VIFVLATFATFWSPVFAQRLEQAPPELQEVGVTEHLDARLPLELPFVDADGRKVTLGDFFDGQRPVLLTMNYSNCPMLCNLQLTGLFEGLGRMDWNIGQNFQMVTVSIDPKEIPERARLTKQKYLKTYGRPAADSDWHFLTGEEDDIRQLAKTLGFGYHYDKDTQQYAHPAVTFVCTPDGRVSRYLYGIEYDPQTLRLALVEAGEGKIGSTLDRALLFCFHYDETKGRYGPAAMKIMRLGGLATVVVLGAALGILWRRERKRSRQESIVKQESADDAAT
jgi:protein SCO1/2